MKRMQSQQQDESSPQEVAMVSAKAREEKVQEVLGTPPEPPLAPKGNSSRSVAWFYVLSL